MQTNQSPTLQHNINLEEFTTLACPAIAAEFYAIASKEQLQSLVSSQSLKLPLRILGGGSNSIITGNFDGTVLHNEITGITETDSDSEFTYLEVGAGENWHEFVLYSIAHNLGGLENLSLIPGQVGGAPIQNIGAYGAEAKDTITYVKAVELATGNEQTFDNAACKFAYRDSIFKHDNYTNKFFITAVGFKLSKNPQLNLKYKGLQQALQDIANPTISDVSQAVCKIRQQKLPDPKTIPNVGSFFKNPVISAALANDMQQQYAAIPLFKQTTGYKISAAWLIEQAGFKGKCINGVCTHKHHALVIINPEHKTGAEVLNFAKQIQQAVADKFAITLEIEPRVL